MEDMLPLYIGVGIFFSGIALAVLTVLTIWLLNLGPVEIGRETWYRQIYSIRNNESIEGHFSSSFFIGSGSIEGVEKYYMFAGTKRENTMERLTVNTADSYIVEREGTTPRIEWQTIKTTIPKEILLWPQITFDSQTKYDIIVPKGTIIQQFKLQ